jgi:phosphoribosyl 1,2-cyclic phosphate phosphodiesterase
MNTLTTLRITLLGTGGSAGVPQIGGHDGGGEWGACDPHEPRNQRTRSSIVIQGGDTTLLVDTSPDMRTQLLNNRIRRADAVLFTHAHADHVAGLDDIRMLNRVVDRPLMAYATSQTLGELSQRFDYAFRAWDPDILPRGFFRPVLVPCPIASGQVVEIGDLAVSVFNQDHGFTSSLGLRIGGFGYSTDAVSLDEMAFNCLTGVDTWVVGCFQRDPPHRTHAWLARIYEWQARLRPRRIILTHMGIDMDWAWLLRNLPAGIEPGYDGTIIEIR